MTPRDVYSIQWHKDDKRHKILCNNKPVGQIVKQPDTQFQAEIGKLTVLAWTPGNALEKAVRQLDPMAIVHTVKPAR